MGIREARSSRTNTEKQKNKRKSNRGKCNEKSSHSHSVAILTLASVSGGIAAVIQARTTSSDGSSSISDSGTAPCTAGVNLT